MTAAHVLLVGLGGWFALNMGASGLAPAFGAALGARVVEARRAAWLFGLFVIAGAVALGPAVAKTLTSGIVPPEHFDERATLVILVATNVAMLVANLASIPQSTSWVMVASLVALGAQQGALLTRTLTHRLLPAWLLLPLASFALSSLVMRTVYPLRGPRSFAMHGWLQRHRAATNALVIASACYTAFAIGANNVANAVAPLSAAGIVRVSVGMLVLAPFFGVGARVFSGPASTIARGIVPIGLVTASICNAIGASLLLVASSFGLPQSLVQLNAAAVLGVALVKDGPETILEGKNTRRMLALWAITPTIAAALTYAALSAWERLR
jgi:sulfate permease